MTKKKHPVTRYERLQLEKIKSFENRKKDRASHVRHEREETTVKELEDALKREPLFQEHYTTQSVA